MVFKWYLVRYMVGYMVWYDIWYDIWYGVWYGVWYGMAVYGIYSMVHGRVWYMVRYTNLMIWYRIWYFSLRKVWCGVLKYGVAWWCGMTSRCTTENKSKRFPIYEKQGKQYHFFTFHFLRSITFHFHTKRFHTCNYARRHNNVLHFGSKEPSCWRSLISHDQNNFVTRIHSPWFLDNISRVKINKN